MRTSGVPRSTRTVSRPTTRPAASRNPPASRPTSWSVPADEASLASAVRPIRSSETRSLCDSAGLSESSEASSVAGVPLSVSVISLPCTLVTALTLRSGSIRFGLAKSIEP